MRLVPCLFLLMQISVIFWQRLYFESAFLQHIIISPISDQRIFIPDTFFQNEKDGKKHDVDKPNVMIRVYNGTGKVLYSTRYGSSTGFNPKSTRTVKDDFNFLVPYVSGGLSSRHSDMLY